MHSDPISESTPKRRKINHASGGYDSGNDSGDELFDGFQEQDTVATVPLLSSQRPSGIFASVMSQIQSDTPPARHVTQPTQPLSSPSVQVARSSPQPMSPSPRSQRTQFAHRKLASAMAPPGTSFRQPAGVQPRPSTQEVIDIFDDPPINLDSDDDEPQYNASIKPTTFTKGAKADSPSVKESPQPNVDKFKSFTSQYAYNGSSKSDDTSSAYGGQDRRRKLQQGIRQGGPSKAAPVVDLTLDDIFDSCVRQDVERMHGIYPNKTIRELEAALKKSKYNFNDALEEVVRKEEDDGELHIDLTSSDLESNASKPAARPIAKKPAAKQELKAPTRTIQEKYSSTTRPSLPKASPQSQEVAKPRRRLMHGRKHPSSPVELSPVRQGPTAAPRKINRITIDSDSEDELEAGIASADEVEEETDANQRLLNFFNSCSAADLADLANEKEATATFILSHKPFKSLNAIRIISEPQKPTKSGKRGGGKPKMIGERILDVCEEMWTGYEAVDQLVETCDALGKPITDTMKAWGLDLLAASKTGEMAFTKIEDAHDSGIGTPTSSILEDDVVSPNKKKGVFLKQPALMPAENVTMKDYQLFGLNWLNLLWSQKLSCILADDMGLGKTCQVIAFLSHLCEIGTPGVHVVIVPGSTLENWLREFQRFAPGIRVEPYYGSMAEREDQRLRLEDEIEDVNVIVTTYDTAVGEKGDNKFLRRIKPTCCIFDEGHTLKNSTTKRHVQLMRIPAQFRLLLTGTPLQNNLQELVSLLGFILPHVFDEKREELESIFKYKASTNDSDHAALLSAQRIARARSMMAPFILRRKKADVLKDIPAKHSRVELCDMVPVQRDFYNSRLQHARESRLDPMRGKKGGSKTSFHMMALRLAALHPLLQKRIYTEEKLAELQRILIDNPRSEFRDNREDLVAKYLNSDLKGGDFGIHKFCSERADYIPAKYMLKKDEWMDSGKIHKLRELLTKFIANGDRVLIFSQFTTMMDILEAVLETLSIKFTRLDGSTQMAQRQDIIDQFTVDESIPVFMLSTKAGGAGINLACANKVIIVDSSFNPQEDIQAENRAHRVGQTREVEVVRLVTKGTIEEAIYALGESKLALDNRVAGGSSAAAGDEKQAEKDGEKMVEKMLFEQLDEEDKVDVKEKDAEALKLCEGGGDIKEHFRAELKKAGLDVQEE